MLSTTFALLHKAGACTGRYRYLAEALGGIKKYGRDKPIPLAVLLKHNGIADALWSLRAVPEDQAATRDKLARLFACDCAAHVLKFFGKAFPGDKRPREAIEVARRYARGKATEEELAAAWDAAWAAAWAAARAAAGDAARAAAWDAAWAAAWAAARDAAWAAARDAAWAAARDAAGDAAGDAERRWQVKTFKKRLEARHRAGKE